MGMSGTRIQVGEFAPGLTKSIDFSISIKPGQQISRPGPVLLLGAPGVGKGTQADTLATLWGVPKISTGDILRENVANRTELGAQADRVMKLGGLVPDEMMTGMVADRLRAPDTLAGFILDGFPRTVGQAQWLDQHLEVHRADARLAVVSMYMEPRRIVERVVHRRICPLCKTAYNTQSLPPKRLGRCDKDGAELIQRSDDSPEVFAKRLGVFKQETEPLLEYYHGHSLFIEVDAAKSPASVSIEIASGLMNFRARLAQ